MAQTADTLSERRRLARRLSLWRGLAIGAACLAVVGVATALFGRGALTGSGQHVARFTVSGVITGDRGTLRMIETIGQSRAAGVLMIIDSPGGTVPGSEALHESLRRLAEKKPVVAVVNNLAA
ncbi:MAG: signal peptide peptidase SppA, partial [Beijerinckiaceae bacterium]